MTTPQTATMPKANKAKVRSRRAKKSKKNIEKEIQKCQESPNPMIPATCVRRCITSAVRSHGTGLRVSQEAQRMLHTGLEAMMVKQFQKANRLAELSHRETVTAEDLQQVAFFEG